MHRPTQRNLVTFAILLGLVAWSLLRAFELRRKEQTIRELESQVRVATHQADRWREQFEIVMRAYEEKNAELMKLQSAAAGSTGEAETEPGSP